MVMSLPRASFRKFSGRCRPCAPLCVAGPQPVSEREQGEPGEKGLEADEIGQSKHPKIDVPHGEGTEEQGDKTRDQQPPTAVIVAELKRGNDGRNAGNECPNGE